MIGAGRTCHLGCGAPVGSSRSEFHGRDPAAGNPGNLRLRRLGALSEPARGTRRQDRPSAISRICHQPVRQAHSADRNDMGDISEADKLMIRRDFSKSFLQELVESAARLPARRSRVGWPRWRDRLRWELAHAHHVFRGSALSKRRRETCCSRSTGRHDAICRSSGPRFSR